MWIDSYNGETSGTIGYLVETLNTSNGRTTFSLHERPIRTNQSNVPRLQGWCGETNNRSHYARGLVRVTGANASKDRIRVAAVKGDDARAFLEADGYPDLA
jgi:hypothetical protein